MRIGLKEGEKGDGVAVRGGAKAANNDIRRDVVKYVMER